MSVCPSRDDLRRLASASLDTAGFAALEEHLEGCDCCRRELERHIFEQPWATPSAAQRLSRSPALPPEVPGYRIERELGRGGMGVVYLAHRLDDGRPVALKLLGGGPDDLARWRREAEAMRRIDHPGVVRLLDSGEVGGRAFLAMEYVAGGTLHDRLDPARPPTPAEAARVVEVVARAIAEVHRCGLLHLDLKPSNVLLGGEPGAPIDRCRPRVADFGLALPCDDPDATWTMAAGPRGTPSYMAPEQLAPERSALGPAADVYALGALLYRMLTGRPPFLAPTKIETYLQLRDRDPVAPRRLNPAVPRDLETICLACLRKRPGRRYGSAGTLADDLRRFLDGRPIAERPTPRPVVAARWCLRHRAVAGLGVASVVLAVALMVVQSSRLRAARIEDARQAREVARLEENLRLASQVFRHYQDFTSSALFARRSIEADELIEELAPLRDRLRASWEAGTLDPANLVALGQVNLTMAQVMIWGGRSTDRVADTLDAALVSLEEAVRLAPTVDEFRRSLDEAKLVVSLLQLSLADFDLVDAKAADALAHLRSLPPGAIGRPGVVWLLRVYEMMAMRRYLIGDRESARHWLEAGRRMSLDLDLADPGRDWLRSPEIARILAVMELGLGREDAALDAWVGAPQDFGLLNPDPFVHSITKFWFVIRLGGSVGLPDLGAAPDSRWRGSPAELADVILEDGARLGLDTPAVLASVQMAFSYFGTNHRWTGNLDGAELAASQCLGLARELTTRMPDEAAAHDLLAESYVQVCKNGWKRDDRAAIRRGLALAIEARRVALALDPDNENYRLQVAELTRRLDELVDD